MMTIHPRQRKIQTSKKISANKRAQNNFPQPLAEPKKKPGVHPHAPRGVTELKKKPGRGSMIYVEQHTDNKHTCIA